MVNKKKLTLTERTKKEPQETSACKDDDGDEGAGKSARDPALANCELSRSVKQEAQADDSADQGPGPTGRGSVPGSLLAMASRTEAEGGENGQAETSKSDSFTVAHCHQMATRSATGKLSRKCKRDMSPPSSPPPQKRAAREAKTSISGTSGGTPETKTRKQWELWNITDKTLFFRGLYEHGKDFEAIQNFIQLKHKKRDSNNAAKTKEQVRHFYYRTWHKVAKFIDVEGIDDNNKQALELYSVINYGEFRKRNPKLDDKNGQKLNELVHHGSTVVKFKSKNYRIKTPFCTALKKLNKIDDGRDEVARARMPERVTLELFPHSNAAWSKVQSVAQNPRLRVTVKGSKRMSTIFDFLNKKWRTDMAKLQEKFEQQSEETTELKLVVPDNCNLSSLIVRSAPVLPRPDLNFTNFLNRRKGLDSCASTTQSPQNKKLSLKTGTALGKLEEEPNLDDLTANSGGRLGASKAGFDEEMHAPGVSKPRLDAVMRTLESLRPPDGVCNLIGDDEDTRDGADLSTVCDNEQQLGERLSGEGLEVADGVSLQDNQVSSTNDVDSSGLPSPAKRMASAAGEPCAGVGSPLIGVVNPTADLDAGGLALTPDLGPSADLDAGPLGPTDLDVKLDAVGLESVGLDPVGLDKIGSDPIDLDAVDPDRVPGELAPKDECPDGDSPEAGPSSAPGSQPPTPLKLDLDNSNPFPNFGKSDKKLEDSDDGEKLEEGSEKEPTTAEELEAAEKLECLRLGLLHRTSLSLTVAEVFMMAGCPDRLRLEYDWVEKKPTADILQMKQNLTNMLRRLAHLASTEFVDFKRMKPAQLSQLNQSPPSKCTCGATVRKDGTPPGGARASRLNNNNSNTSPSVNNKLCVKSPSTCKGQARAESLSAPGTPRSSRSSTPVHPASPLAAAQPTQPDENSSKDTQKSDGVDPGGGGDAVFRVPTAAAPRAQVRQPQPILPALTPSSGNFLTSAALQNSAVFANASMAEKTQLLNQMTTDFVKKHSELFPVKRRGVRPIRKPIVVQRNILPKTPTPASQFMTLTMVPVSAGSLPGRVANPPSTVSSLQPQVVATQLDVGQQPPPQEPSPQALPPQEPPPQAPPSEVETIIAAQIKDGTITTGLPPSAAASAGATSILPFPETGLSAEQPSSRASSLVQHPGSTGEASRAPSGGRVWGGGCRSGGRSSVVRRIIPTPVSVNNSTPSVFSTAAMDPEDNILRKAVLEADITSQDASSNSATRVTEPQSGQNSLSLTEALKGDDVMLSGVAMATGTPSSVSIEQRNSSPPNISALLDISVPSVSDATDNAERLIDMALMNSSGSLCSMLEATAAQHGEKDNTRPSTPNKQFKGISALAPEEQWLNGEDFSLSSFLQDSPAKKTPQSESVTGATATAASSRSASSTFTTATSSLTSALSSHLGAQTPLSISMTELLAHHHHQQQQQLFAASSGAGASSLVQAPLSIAMSELLAQHQQQSMAASENSRDSFILGRLDVDTTLQCMMNENSMDYIAKFADLAAQISTTGNAESAAVAHTDVRQ